MAFKVESQKPSIQQLKEELAKIKSSPSQSQSERLHEIVRQAASIQAWDLTKEGFELIKNEEERNLMIGDVIEEFLLPQHAIDQAKQFAKYITPSPEIQPLIAIRIALAENNPEEAKRIAERLPSPLSRNFGFIQILEFYILNNEKDRINELTHLIVKNTHTIYDSKIRSQILRDIAIDVFLGNRLKLQAQEIAQLIPTEEIKQKVLNKIGLDQS